MHVSDQRCGLHEDFVRDEETYKQAKSHNDMHQHISDQGCGLHEDYFFVCDEETHKQTKRL